MKQFQAIHELATDDCTFLCVLIDEVESLTAARKAAISGNEPSDAVRVVNAILTQIDLLKERQNVMIFTTTNLTQAIDVAFIDRADIKQYIGLPNHRARYIVMSSCILELRKAGIINTEENLLDYRSVELMKPLDPNRTAGMKNSFALYDVSAKADGLSGRALRKLPFLAHAFFIEKELFSLEEFIEALDKAIAKESLCRKELEHL